MIELPEAETLRRDLDRDLTGKKVKSIEVLVPKLVGGAAAKAHLIEVVTGAKITATLRRANRVGLVLDAETVVLIELGEDASLVRAGPKQEVAKKTVWVLTAPPAGQIRLVDPHATSSTLVGNLATLEEDIPWVGALGIDPVEHAMSWVAYARVLYAHKGPLKRVLMDSTVVAGIGPLYADEILFEAGLRFDRETTSLNEQELRRLYRATVEILHDAIKHRGTSLPRRPFADLAGKPGGFADLLQIYGREGQLSPRSRRPIAKTVFEGLDTWYCEQSQV